MDVNFVDGASGTGGEAAVRLRNKGRRNASKIASRAQGTGQAGRATANQTANTASNKSLRSVTVSTDEDSQLCDLFLYSML